MNRFKVASLMLTMLITFCLEIGLQTSSVAAAPVFFASAMTISSSTQTNKGCQYAYKHTVYNNQKDNVGFVYLWAGTCSDNASLHMTTCSSSISHFWISINLADKVHIKC